MQPSKSPDVLPGLPDPWPEMPIVDRAHDWACKPDVKEKFVKAFLAIQGAVVPPPASDGEDGIVIVGGGPYWLMVCVAVKMCRSFCDLPIQVWYRGEAEPINEGDLSEVEDVSFHDTTQFSARIHGGWQSKSIALVNCGFERVLYLDADAYLVSSPGPLFDLLCPANPFLFWEDVPAAAAEMGWAWFGVPELAGSVPRVQGGQLCFDRVRFWKHLVRFHWLCQHSDYTFHFPVALDSDKEKRHGYGDQDQWRCVLAIARQGYRSLGRARWYPPAFHCWTPLTREHGGEPVIVHRPQAKWWGEPADKKVPTIAGEQLAWSFRDELVFPPARPAEAVFGRIYESGWWGEKQSSGQGSQADQVEPFIRAVNSAIQEHGWKSAVDLGCGEGAVALHLVGVEVTGVDVSRRHVGELAKRGTSATFSVMDISTQREQLPCADVAIIRDVLQHWPNDLVLSWLRWAQLAGKWKAIIVANDVDQAADDVDCALGSYRPLSADKRPLSLLVGWHELVRHHHKAAWILETD